MFEKTGTHRIVDVMFDAPASSIRFDPLERAKGSFRAEGAGGCRGNCASSRAASCPRRRKASRSSTTALGTSSSASPSPSSRAQPSRKRRRPSCPSRPRSISPSGDLGPLDRIAAIAASLPAGDPALPFLAGLNGEHGGRPGIVSTLSNCPRRIRRRQRGPDASR